MTPTLRALVMGLAAISFVGCGSGSGSTNVYRDAATMDVLPLPDAGVQDVRGDVVKPPPVSGAGNSLLFRGPAELISHGPACSGEVGSTRDRWCAFLAPSQVNIGAVDLFVINVTQAAGGVAVTCGTGLDPNCLKLTGGFFEEAATKFPHAAGFQGDTLVYFDLTLTPYAWRPGMANGKVLAYDQTGSIHDCLPSAKGTSVLCLKDVVPQPVAGITQSELLAGKLDAAADPPLAKVETVISNDSTIGTSPQRFRYGFSPDGEWVAWSSAATKGGVEILKTQRIGDDATRITVATDVARWALAPDGARWFWLSQFNYDATGMRSGTLQTAPFPAGASPETLLERVGDYAVTRTGALVARTMVSQFRGDLKSIPDPRAAPTNVVPLDTGVLGVINIGPLGHVVYTKAAHAEVSLYNLLVKKLDGTGSLCALTNQTNGFDLALFLPNGGGVAFVTIPNIDTATDDELNLRESFTRLSDCTTSTVANNIGNFGIASDTGILIQDEADGIDGTLRIRGVTPALALAPGSPALIQTRVRNFISVIPFPGVVLFTVAAQSDADGLYLHALDQDSSGDGMGGASGSAGADAGAVTPDNQGG